jgi:hypothetical protein
MVTGPAEILYRLTVPPAARLHGRIVLGADTTNPARFTASIQDGDASSEVAALVLKRPLFGAGSPQDLSADLSRWAGKRIGLRFAIYPKSCVSSVATVTVLDASIRTDALGARDSLE